MGPPGKKYRCPACSTPFVFGARTNEGSPGEPEYMAFEIADEGDVAAPKSQAPARPSRPPAKPAASKSQVVTKKPAAKPPISTSGARSAGATDNEDKLRSEERRVGK